MPRVSKKPHPASWFRCKLGYHPKAQAWESTYHPLSVSGRGHARGTTAAGSEAWQAKRQLILPIPISFLTTNRFPEGIEENELASATWDQRESPEIQAPVCAERLKLARRSSFYLENM